MLFETPQFWIAAFSVLFGAFVTAAVRKINGDREVVAEAKEVVGTNKTLQATVNALQACNDALEGQVATLQADFTKALGRIAELERIIRDMSTVREIKRRRIALANEDVTP